MPFQSGSPTEPSWGTEQISELVLNLLQLALARRLPMCYNQCFLSVYFLERISSIELHVKYLYYLINYLYETKYNFLMGMC